MILVPNLRLLLNGNKQLLIILCCSMILGCATTSPVSSDREILDKDERVTPEEVVEKIDVDTISWTFTSEEELPPISAETRVAAYSLEKVNKEYYRIALLLPMRIEQIIPTLDVNNKKFADFYAGLKLAASESTDVRAHIKVYYTNRSEARVNEIIRDMDLDLPDLIIGPYETKLISKLADFAQENRVPLISPWKSNTGITDDNLFYLQMRPGIEHYYQRIVDHVNYNFDRAEVAILQRPDGVDYAKTNLVEKINQELSSLPVVQPYSVIDIALDSLMDAEANVFDTLLQQDYKAFILPHFSSRDESFVYSCLRKMYGEKNDRDLFVYTMPIALSSDRVDINILKNLNIRTAEFRFPDPQNRDVINFKEHFQNRYGWLPTEDSYYGYDLMQFVLYGLENHGQYFHYFMKDEDLDLMQMRVNIGLYFKDSEEEHPDFLVNRHLYIIEYEKDHFVISDIR